MRRRGRHFLGCCQSAGRPLLPTAGGVWGRRLRLAYLFVAERGDPRLPFVELLLEVAVLRKHGGAGSGRPPRGVECARGPAGRSPPTPDSSRTGLSAARPKFPGPRPARAAAGQCRAGPLTCGCRLIGAARGAGRGPRPPGGAPRAVQVCRQGCVCE